MATCPKCGNIIPPGKLLFLTTRRPSVTCPVCSSKLRWKNTGIGRLIGGLGGGVGAGVGGFFAELWGYTGNIMYIGLVVATIVGVFLAAWGATARFYKFELENTPYSVHT